MRRKPAEYVGLTVVMVATRHRGRTGRVVGLGIVHAGFHHRTNDLLVVELDPVGKARARTVEVLPSSTRVTDTQTSDVG